MAEKVTQRLPAPAGNGKRFCLACGRTADMHRRRYCSVDCRQRLRYTLNVRTGLLRALNTRYATFYFIPSVIILDVLPYGSHRILSYFYPRNPNEKPADDFRRMSDVLGNAWWDEVRRTQKRYLANRIILNKARPSGNSITEIKPPEIRRPAGLGESLTYLQLTRNDLDSPALPALIKQAYRRSAKRCHPDTGGNGHLFLKVQQAYEQLMQWAESPTYTKRRGFPDKWFYSGENNRWVQPTPRKP
jgi:hypothetical protein